jgi:hypothetical protein
MRKLLLSLAALAVIAAPIRASELEVLSNASAVRFQAAQFSLSVLKFAPTQMALRGLAFKAGSVTVLDIERLYTQGAKVEKKDLSGWFAGRRYSAKGASPQLLVGADILRDADAGPLGGADFKLASFGGDEPGLSPADLYDAPGSETVNAVISITRDEAAGWKVAEFKDTGATGQDKRSAFEIRKNGDLLVAKYIDGTYAYFFKRVW